MTQPPPEPEPQSRGYLVVLRPEATYDAFLEELERRSPDLISWWKGAFIDDVPGVDPKRYKGWDRYPVERALSESSHATWPAQREEMIAHGCDPTAVPEQLDDLYSRAEHLMTERLGEDPNIYWQVHFVSPAVIPDLALAQEILAATDEPERREIIHLVRIQDDPGDGAGEIGADSPTPATLGFDLGYWGGPFSLISDTMLYPRWHSGPDEAIPALREHAKVLNEHMLFPTVEGAKAFRAWYREQEWAELEWHDGAFCIARIDRT